MDFNQQPTVTCPGMLLYPRNLNYLCIYRVLNLIRKLNQKAYTPQLVLIRPLHRSLKSQALEALVRGEDITYTMSMGYLDMEEHQKNYLQEFRKRRFFGEEIIRCVLVETLPKYDVENSNPIKHIHNAENITSGGVKFEVFKEEFSMNVRFENSCLRMSRLKVDDEIELTMRKIMTLEKGHYPYDHTLDTMAF